MYLRHYVNYAQDNWTSLLPWAQLALNNNVSETTKVSPFFANFGKEPNLFMDPRPNPQAEKAIVATNEMKKLHDMLRSRVTQTQDRVARQLQGKRKTAPQLKKGDKVYLNTKNLKTRRMTKKLDQVKVGPFLIAERRGPQNYRLELPKDAHIHPVFHISLLEPADASTPVQTTFHFEPEEDDIYEVERIEGISTGGKYIIKWKRYPKSENTLEPASELGNCWKAFKKYFDSGDTRQGYLKQGHPIPDISTKAKFNNWIRQQRNQEESQGRNAYHPSPLGPQFPDK